MRMQQTAVVQGFAYLATSIIMISGHLLFPCFYLKMQCVYQMWVINFSCNICVLHRCSYNTYLLPLMVTILIPWLGFCDILISQVFFFFQYELWNCWILKSIISNLITSFTSRNDKAFLGTRLLAPPIISNTAAFASHSECHHTLGKELRVLPSRVYRARTKPMVCSSAVTSVWHSEWSKPNLSLFVLTNTTKTRVLWNTPVSFLPFFASNSTFPHRHIHNPNGTRIIFNKRRCFYTTSGWSCWYVVEYLFINIMI